MSAKEKPPVFAALKKGAGAVFSRLPFAARFSAKNPEPAPGNKHPCSLKLGTPL